MAEGEGRTYGYCASCGVEKPLAVSYVCDKCRGWTVGLLDKQAPDWGLYCLCAACGDWMFEDHHRSRRYVHTRCKVRNRKAPRSTKAQPVGSVCPVCFQVRSASGLCGCLD